MSIKIGTGVFTWEGGERRCQRYGNVHLADSPYSGKLTGIPFNLDLGALTPMLGKRVRITCTVTATRKSGHVGDQFLGIQPVTPNMGEVIVLGVGLLVVGIVKPWESRVTTSIGLLPEDCRSKFWLDPKILYRLHDQTVDMYVEETTDPCHPAPEFQPSAEGALANDDGTFQVVTEAPSVTILPRMTSLGSERFKADFDYRPGERMGAVFGRRS